MQIEALCDANRAAALALLERFKETSLFLLGNLAEQGPVLRATINSGNFKCLVDHGAVVAVFSLSRRGNLCMQSDRQRDYSTWILDACAEEPITLGGVVSDFALAVPLMAEHVRRRPRFAVTFNSKEDLLALDLTTTPPVAEPNGAVRMLEHADFAQWEPLESARLEEDGLPVQGSIEQRLESFRQSVDRRRRWGLFHQSQLSSIANVTAHVGDMANIGGVFTIAGLRRRGFSRAVMRRLIADCDARDIRTLILFTGEQNRAARSMYDSLGFQHIGHFSLIFGEERKAGRRCLQ